MRFHKIIMVLLRWCCVSAHMAGRSIGFLALIVGLLSISICSWALEFSPCMFNFNGLILGEETFGINESFSKN